MPRFRTFVSRLFLASVLFGIVWFGAQAWIGLSEADPTKLRINRIPLGASMIVIIEGLLAVLWFRGGELTGLVRLFAGLMGIVQGLQVLVGAIASLTDGLPFPTANHWAMGGLVICNFLYALFGEARRRPVDAPGAAPRPGEGGA
jgi:hypothetical protein